jgi:hypothetical protein
MTHNANRFRIANKKSPVVYGSTEGRGCFYRLADGQTFTLSHSDCEHVGHPRWAHIREEIAA